tara:strand:+ start:535 stop:762 length:228 start_codon:yes stop_codon:yes gene_type:complete
VIATIEKNIQNMIGKIMNILNSEEVGLIITNTPINPIMMAVQRRPFTTSPRTKIDSRVLNIGDAKVNDIVVASGR